MRFNKECDYIISKMSEYHRLMIVAGCIKKPARLERSGGMQLARFIMSIVFAAIIAAAGVVNAQPPAPRSPDQVTTGNLSIQERAPAFSSPEVEMAPNGDRVSPYPPYYHPERD